jgi:CRISPR type I-E-associated protein CasB/Cse2
MTKDTQDKRPALGLIVLEWWSALQPHSGEGERRGGNPGALARLRRADLLGAAMEEVTIDLFTRLTSISKLPRDILFERTALIAAVLAHVREHGNLKVAAAAGETTGDDHRVLHPLRLRRLFAAREERDCVIAFRRLIALLGKKANVADLAETLLDWPDERQGDVRRRRWAFDYYGAGFAAPEDHEQAA